MKAITCPICKKRFSFFNFIKSPSPYHMQCTHCKTKLRVAHNPGIYLAILLAMGLIIGITVSEQSTSILQTILYLASAALVLEVVIFLVIGFLGVELTLRERHKTKTD